ncbi:hypothetical protein L6255_01305 [Candidatus Parcubacteria bacterium]|nr:hypothetical protein [Patescibacteria group bacterium]MBU4381041.1 hypothetical protein [Patescibacteria group bacterium]MCG2689056.1 hypothetical protein [Candidatus Parcubacteria bacterium]
MKYYELDKEEQKIAKSFDEGKLKSVPNASSAIKNYVSYARSTFNKTRNINIRLSQKDLLKLKSKAVEEGLPYQTLVSSVLHKYAN